MINIEPFTPYYKVYNKTHRLVEFVSDSLFDAYCFTKEHHKPENYKLPLLSYTLKKEPLVIIKDLYSKAVNSVQVLNPPEIVILTELGDIVQDDIIRQEVKNHRRYSTHDFFRERNRKDYNLLFTKRNYKKLKPAYKKIKHNSSLIGNYYVNAESCGTFRRISTFSEVKQTCGHQTDYGKNIVRPNRGYKTMPDSWDDIQCGVWKKQYSWKHNSKRRKQWVPV